MVGAHAAGWPQLRARTGEAARLGGPAAPGTSPGGTRGAHSFCTDYGEAMSVMFGIVWQTIAEIRLAEPGCVRICEDLCGWGPVGADNVGYLRKSTLGRAEPFGRRNHSRAAGAPANIPAALGRSSQNQHFDP